MYEDYGTQPGGLTNLMMPLVAHYLRLWDAASAARVDCFIANSETVAARIRRYYRRESEVIWPPVDTDAFTPAPENERGDYMLMVGELVAYKRPELAVEAFNRMGTKLVVIGGGEKLPRIRRLARPTLNVLRPRPLSGLPHHFSR